MRYIAKEVSDQLYELQNELDDIYTNGGSLVNVIWRETDHVYIVIYGLGLAAASRSKASQKSKEGE